MIRAWLMVVAVGCQTFDAGQYAPDPGYPGVDDTGGADDGRSAIDCSDQQDFNWINFGEGFFIESCNGCHFSETPDRYGAPEYATFDTVDDVWAQKGMILAVAAGHDPSMPPNGGTTDLDRMKLEIWLTCGDPGR